MLVHDRGSCKDALYAKVRTFVLAQCPYLFWWTNETEACAGQAAELKLHEAAYPKFNADVAGHTKLCSHCKKAFPKGDTLPGQTMKSKNAKLCIFWTREMWKNRKNRPTCRVINAGIRQL